MNAASVSTGQIGDYMGLPIYSGGAGPGMTVNELPFRAYNLIWNFESFLCWKTKSFWI